MRKVLLPRICPFVCLTLLCILLFSCQKETSNNNTKQETATLQIRFKPTVDGNDLVFGQTYKNAFSEDFSIKTFKFYIHGIELMNSQTNTMYKVDKSDHWLIDVADSANSYAKVSIKPSSYNRIGFIVGVDSIRNVSGAQTGALDPAKGMFWTWSTGYIMAKLEGNSPVATTPNHVIEYHIGGFRGAETVIRKVVLDLPPLQMATVQEGTISTITLAANVNTWFNQAFQIRISEKPVSMTPGVLAAQIADNYSRMFTVVQVVNE